MKKLKYLFAFALIVPAFALFGCGKDNKSTEEVISNTIDVVPSEGSISLNVTNADVDLYGTCKLEASLENVTGNITWKSDDENIATVDENGLVSAKAVGKTTIRAIINNLEATCIVTVDTFGQIPVLNVWNENLVLKIGHDFLINPSFKIQGKELDATFEYTSEDTNIATIDVNGNINAISTGHTTINVVATYDEYVSEKSIEIRVIPDVTVDVGIDVVDIYTIATENCNTSYQINARIFENNIQVDNPKITWQTEDDGVATIENGLISAVAAGETNIYAIYQKDGEDLPAKIKVNVLKPVIDLSIEDGKVDLGADDKEVIEFGFSEFEDDLNNLVKITSISNHNLEIPFNVVDKKLSISRDDIKIGKNQLNFEFEKVIYNTQILFICDKVNLVRYEESTDAGKVSVYWGDSLGVSISNDIKFEDEKGTLKVTLKTANNWNYIIFETVEMDDVSDFEYIAFNCYNPNDYNVAITLLWCGDTICPAHSWTEVKFPFSLFKINKVVNMNENQMFPSNISGLPIVMYMDQLSAGDSFYLSYLYAGKKHIDPERKNVVAGFDINDANISLSSTQGKATYTTDVHYEDEAGSMRIEICTNSEVYISLNAPDILDVSKYEYISYHIYNPNDTTFQAGYLWASDTLCETGKWTEIVLPVESFDITHIDRVNGSSISSDMIVGLGLRLLDLGRMSIGDYVYISSVRVH